MRYVGAPAIRALLVATAALAASCAADAPTAAEGGAGSAPPLPPIAPPADACGDSAALPARATKDDHTVTLACDGDARVLAVTVLDDGIVRLRYGEDARGSIVPVERPAAREPLRVGGRGASAIVCTRELELAIAPGTCKLSAKDLATGLVVLEDGEGGGYFRASARAKGAAADAEVAGVVRASPEGERIYGLGLHTASAPASARGLDLRGSVVELYNTDAYDPAAGGFRPDASPLYETIPFYVGLRQGDGKTAAYGVFTDNTHRTRFDLAATERERVRVTAWGGAIDQYLFAGPRVREVVRRYTRVTGTTPLPPPWALGFHQSRWEGPCDGAPAERPFCSAAQIVSVARRFRDEKIPADGLFLDIHHMDGFRSFTYDPARFADPEGMFRELASLGFAPQAILDPAIKIDPAWSVYTDGVAGGHFLKEPSGAIFEGEVWPGPAVFPDFSANKTRAWWADLVRAAATRGLRGMWIDMNEPASFGAAGTVPDSVIADGDGRKTTLAELHNAYAWFEAKATYEGMRAARPSERPFVLSRAAFAGQQRHAAVWTGDAPSTWATLRGTLPQLLHLGMSGMAFAGSDVGGYSGGAESSADLYGRWAALGAVSPFFRAHAEKNARRQEPWSFDAETLDATRALVSRRYELMPYLYGAFEEATRTGAPVLRPLVFDFQDDARAGTVADEAMLGPSLLVAPIVDATARERKVYLPASFPGERWYEVRSGAAYAGGQTITISAAPEALPRDALPMFAREGAIVPRTAAQSHVGADPAAPLTVDVYPGRTRSTYTLYEDDGKLAPAASRITLTLEPTDAGARLTASARDGSYVSPRAQVIVRVMSDPTAAPVTLGAAVPFSAALAFDPKRVPESDVRLPITVHLPPGTPADAPIHVATSTRGWTHAPLVRTGDVATGAVTAPRGGWVFFKITRGDWPTVEKAAACAAMGNRHALGAEREPIEVTVASWADGC